MTQQKNSGSLFELPDYTDISTSSVLRTYSGEIEKQNTYSLSKYAIGLVLPVFLV